MDYNKIAPLFGDWADKFKPFIESKDFDDIFAFLKQESKEGKLICPHHEDVFRAFRETSYKNLRAIFLLQDPYPWIKYDKDRKPIYVADGIAMSCSHTKVCQPSLELFYEGIEDDLGIKIPHEPDLTYLARQGILFLNTSLTVEANKPGSHQGKWDKFIMYLVDEVINFYNTGLIYVSFGADAKVIARAIVPFLHYGIEVEHPAAAAHKERAWNHNNLFRKIAKILKDCNNEQIKWASDGRDVEHAPIPPPIVTTAEKSGTGISGKSLKKKKK